MKGRNKYGVPTDLVSPDFRKIKESLMSRGISKSVSQSYKPMKVTLVILQDVLKTELENAIDIANSCQESFKFVLHPYTLNINESNYLLPNGALDLAEAIEDLVIRNRLIKKLLPRNLAIVTSRPFSDINLVQEFRGKPLIKELSQCYFYNSFSFSNGSIALISTYIWEHLPLRKDIDFPISPSKRRALQPYILYIFGFLVLDLLLNVPVHEETLGCPFDYNNRVYDIDEFFLVNSVFCNEHENFLEKKVKEGMITKKRLNSAVRLFNRARGKPTTFDIGLAGMKLDNLLKPHRITRMSPQVFICYSHDDKRFVSSLKKTLEKYGIRVRIDEGEIIYGESLINKISNVIRDVHCVLLVISHNSVKSKWVQKELQLAMSDEFQAGKVKVIPLLKDNSKLPLSLSDKLCADFQTLYRRRENLPKLIQSIHKLGHNL